jgi:tetratricopeptide (TPR) repeat protein
MKQLKPLSKESIPKALTRAKHYRLLNEPWQAESICKDVLSVDSDNQRALLYLVLAMTDQFGTDKNNAYSDAKEACAKLSNEYERNYYRGIIEERRGMEALKRKTHRVRYIAFEHYKIAMEFFEKAQKIHPPGNEDSVLRWNACVRRIQEFKLKAAPDEDHVQPFLDV